MREMEHCDLCSDEVRAADCNLPVEKPQRGFSTAREAGCPASDCDGFMDWQKDYLTSHCSNFQFFRPKGVVSMLDSLSLYTKVCILWYR